MSRYDIVIIDTGVKSTHPLINEKVDGIHICNGRIVDDNSDDNIGHGTAIYTIIKRETTNTKIFNIKIVDDISDEQDEASLVTALEYIYNYIECSIVNISLGILLPNKNESLKNICTLLSNRNTILVAAYDNFGAVTYPAFFPCVIGVTSDEFCRTKYDFTFYDDENVNVAGNGNIQRVAWIKPDYIFLNGNSLACAHVTSFIYNGISNNACKCDLMSVLDYLRKSSKFIITNKNEYIPRSKPELNKLNKCIVFPFNKEIHPLFRFQELLSFSIVDVYDVKYSGRVGRSVNELLRIANASDFTVKNISSIDWERFDSVIIGHIKDLLTLGNCYEIVNVFLTEAVNRGKYIYSFGDISDLFPILHCSQTNIYTPLLINNNIKKIPDGKLFCINKPILGVFGTSSKQGKYTLQLAIRKELITRGYKVGQIGTEASAYLFNMDECFPFGHGSTISFQRYDVVSYVNNILNELSNKDTDIIISGCQSGTLTDNECSLYRYALPQYEFLLGLNPDAMILCVNQFNDDEEISRHISFLESAVNGRVIALVLFPVTLKNENSWYQNKHQTISADELCDIKTKLKQNHKRQAYILGNEEDLKDLVDLLILHFS